MPDGIARHPLEPADLSGRQPAGVQATDAVVARGFAFAAMPALEDAQILQAPDKALPIGRRQGQHLGDGSSNGGAAHLRILENHAEPLAGRLDGRSLNRNIAIGPEGRSMATGHYLEFARNAAGLADALQSMTARGERFVRACHPLRLVALPERAAPSHRGSSS